MLEIYQNLPVGGTAASKPSPTSQTGGEQTIFNATMTSEWKSKMSPRARGRVQVALPTDGDTTDYDKVPIQADMSIKKEFA